MQIKRYFLIDSDLNQELIRVCKSLNVSQSNFCEAALHTLLSLSVSTVSAIIHDFNHSSDGGAA